MLAQADLASRRRGVTGFDAACVGLVISAVFSADGLRAAFGLAGVAGVTVACAAFFAAARAVRVGVFATGLGRSADRSVGFPVAFALPAAACFARRSGLTGLAALAMGAFVGLVAFAAG